MAPRAGHTAITKASIALSAFLLIGGVCTMLADEHGVGVVALLVGTFFAGLARWRMSDVSRLG